MSVSYTQMTVTKIQTNTGNDKHKICMTQKFAQKSLLQDLQHTFISWLQMI